ncbi:MAG TPA: hypothetical protein QF353_03770 [Gammaproteobacteria bacterium]|nr:hypothetical protein [Gammaproteobacteria bacterium]
MPLWNSAFKSYVDATKSVVNSSFGSNSSNSSAPNITKPSSSSSSQSTPWNSAFNGYVGSTQGAINTMLGKEDSQRTKKRSPSSNSQSTPWNSAFNGYVGSTQGAINTMLGKEDNQRTRKKSPSMNVYPSFSMGNSYPTPSSYKRSRSPSPSISSKIAENSSFTLSDFLDLCFNFIKQVLKIIGYVIAGWFVGFFVLGFLAVIETLLITFLAELTNIILAAAVVLIAYPVAQYLAYLVLPTNTYLELQSKLEPLNEFYSIRVFQPLKNLYQKILSYINSDLKEKARIESHHNPVDLAEIPTAVPVVEAPQDAFFQNTKASAPPMNVEALNFYSEKQAIKKVCDQLGGGKQESFSDNIQPNGIGVSAPA